MSNNQKQFGEFLGNIELVGQDLSSLRTSRDANRDRIRKYWKEKLNRAIPIFEEQGSFEMKTVIQPLEGDYDLDDGLYLQCIGSDPSKWPVTSTVQGWIVSAVEGYTREDPKKMKRCVRVPYKADRAGLSYHIDIPSYGTDSFGTIRVYRKEQAPPDFDESNPVALVDWFSERKKSHHDLRDLVCFFKAWRDKKKGAVLKVKSVTMTILVAEQIRSNVRYDQAVVDTARACELFLRGGGNVLKPVAPFDNLTSGWTQDERTAIADAFKTLADRGADAIAAESERDGALIWQRQFGDRFPVPAAAATRNAAGLLVSSAPAITGSGSFA